METDALISNTDFGLYCAAGDFFIDAWQPVDRTIVTHAHSDHARRGARRYLTARAGELILRKRMGSDAVIDAIDYGRQFDLNGVKVSLHPAGHVLGSAQVRVEHRGEVWVVTGDYKRQADATCTPFELVRCNTLITECTFGLPIFCWRDPAEVARQINDWWSGNIAQNRTSLLLAYSLGKAQRVLSLLDASLEPVLLHGAVHAMAEAYRASGVALPAAEYATPENAKANRGRAMVICPPSAAGSVWTRKFSPLSIGVASGWMQVRGFRRRRAADMGFVLSDHVDWPGLLQTISETGAQHIIATHGYTAPFSRYLQEKGIDASIYSTRFTDAGEEDEPATQEARIVQRFTDLYLRLDRSNRTGDKLEALADYFREAPPEDAIWVVYILTGRKIGRTVSSRQLAQWAAEISGFAGWLVEECYHVVGDLSETLSLLIPYETPTIAAPKLHEIIENRLRPLGKLPAENQRELVLQAWRELSPSQRFVFHKLISGNFRVGVSRQSLVLALARAADVAPAVIAHRLSGQWTPDAAKMEQILRKPSADDAIDEAIPYPFMLAHALTEPMAALGALEDWQIEWKWDGIRAQLLRRGGKSALWSRGDELISGAFPDLVHVGMALPDGTVIDGEIVAWDEQANRPRPFAILQRRLNRKNVELTFWPDVPVKLIAFDLLEMAGRDLRDEPLIARRAMLEELLMNAPASALITLSDPIKVQSWEQLDHRMDESRGRGVEGIMLKRRDSQYLVGRPTGSWWKLKVNPYTVDAVLIAAQPGTGRRAGLLTDYTFGVWNDAHTELVPVAKAYSGLTDAEIAEMDRFVRSHTIARFGPVHGVQPLRVFELGFEAIQRSDRHKSGIALRFPRILRLRDDKHPADADTLAMLEALLNSIENH